MFSGEVLDLDELILNEGRWTQNLQVVMLSGGRPNWWTIESSGMGHSQSHLLELLHLSIECSKPHWIFKKMFPQVSLVLTPYLFWIFFFVTSFPGCWMGEHMQLLQLSGLHPKAEQPLSNPWDPWGCISFTIHRTNGYF